MIAYPTGQEPDFLDPYPGNDDYRFALGKIAGSSPAAPPLVVIGMNPSHARESRSDNTVNHVISVARRDGYSGWLMLNLYPERSPKPSCLNPYDATFSTANCAAIERLLGQLGVTEVLAAWGNLGGSNTLKRAQPDLMALMRRFGIRMFTLDPLTIEGNPRHPHPPGRPLPMLGPKRYLS